MKFIIVILYLPIVSFAQVDITAKDTATVIVQAFLSDKKWKDVPAAVAVISNKQLNALSSNNLLPAFNNITGVKMEERSPGSYRLAIRGSSLRSPFGIRNVKVYYNNIPLTDGGGNTYLNLLSLQQINNAEILKGVASSMYGAGTGGVVLLMNELKTAQQKETHFLFNINGGNFGLFQEDAAYQSENKKFSYQVLQSHQQSDGYRQQSALRKDVVQWNGQVYLNRQNINATVFYTDLFYQTPGGLTLAQMQANPQSARLATATLPSAVQQKTAIYNKTFFAGIHHQYNINQYFNTQTIVSYNHTQFTNPFITNYEERNENNFSVNGKLIYKKKNFQWVNGIEWLNNHSFIDDYGNKSGVKDTVQSKDNLFAAQWFAFTQMQVSFNKFSVQIGTSINQQLFKYKRLTDATQKDFSNANSNIVAAPRVSFLYELTKSISLYSLAAKGFSPPSLAEVHPSDGLFHSELQPEYGWNYEAGIKGSALQRQLLFDVSFYYFQLQNAIIRRNNAAGAEYFVNAGNTVEKGIEIFLQYQKRFASSSFIQSCTINNSYSYQPYYFSNYVQGSNNYSGNSVTGVPKHIWVMGLALAFKHQFSFNINLNNTSSIALNDANDEFSNSYHLLQARLEKAFSLKKLKGSFYVIGDNLLNEQYSLGNDINAAARRYYNPSATINGSIGCKIEL